MSHLGGSPQVSARAGAEVEVAAPAKMLGWLALACSLPFLFVVVPSVVHHDPFVLAHRHGVSGSGWFLAAMTVALDLIWLLLVYVGVSVLVTRQYFSDAGVRYRRLVGSRRLPVEAMTSIRLTEPFRPRAADNLRWQTGVDLGGLVTPQEIPGLQPLLIRGVIGRTALTKLALRVQLQPGRGAQAAMGCVDRWVARRPELLDDAARAYFVARGALPPA